MSSKVTLVCKTCGAEFSEYPCHAHRRRFCSYSCRPTNRGGLTHGATANGEHTPEYRAWSNIRTRCENPNAKGYERWGGRGIAICPQWRNSFAQFLADVGERPSPDHSIDRIDVNGHYEPGNVRWSTRRQQANNTRRNVYFTHEGRTQTLIEWARELGVHHGMLQTRIKLGWTVEEILTTPSGGRPRRTPSHDPETGRFT